MCDFNLKCCWVAATAEFSACIGLAAGAGLLTGGVGAGVGGAYCGWKLYKSMEACENTFNCCLDNCEQPEGTELKPQPNCRWVKQRCKFVLVCEDNARDPNEKVATSGYGPKKHASVKVKIPYTIYFENVPTATAAAQQIRIVDQLSPDVDWRTFRLTEIAFADLRIQVPENRAFYQTRIRVNTETGYLFADINAGIDVLTGKVTWVLTAIDPLTGEQPVGSLAGLLLPNDSTKRGEGYVSYTVLPKNGLPTGKIIENAATITFDTEEPIITNTVRNTIDAESPISTVMSLPSVSPSVFELSWGGIDPADGSGIQSYDIWMAKDSEDYKLYLAGTTDTRIQFTGESGSTYRFYSIAIDNVGNLETAPSSPDTITTIVGQSNPLPIISDATPLSVYAGSSDLTLTINGTNFVSGSVVYWNGTGRTTTFVSTTKLTVLIPAADLATIGTAAVSVFNPAPGGGQSQSVIVTIASLPNPVPVLNTISPTSKVKGEAAFTLTVTGSNFTATSKVMWNGSEIPTTYVSATSLTASITAAQISNTGTSLITVFTPAPGGGVSSAITFTIQQPSQFEGDILPRPDGNQSVTVSDWVQAGRYLIGLDQIPVGSEYQKIDTAPKASQGDGKITISDWIQTGRYAAAIDSLTIAGGPTMPIQSLTSNLSVNPADQRSTENQRQIIVKDTRIKRGSVGIIPIQFMSNGDETGISFTLVYDATKAMYVKAELSKKLSPDSTLLVNAAGAGIGKIGIAMSLPVGKSFSQGIQELLSLQFVAIGGADNSETEVSYDDSVVEKAVVNANAEVLALSDFKSGTIFIEGKSLKILPAANNGSSQASPGSVLNIYGDMLSFTTQEIESNNVPFEVGGTSVKVTDSKGVEQYARILYVSPNNVKFILPESISIGIVTVTITNAVGTVSTGQLNVVEYAPIIYTDRNGLAPASLAGDNQKIITLVGTGWHNISRNKLRILFNGREVSLINIDRNIKTNLDQIHLSLSENSNTEINGKIELVYQGVIIQSIVVAIK